MKECPNPECRYRQRHGEAAEYQDAARSCSDCGSELVTRREAEKVGLERPCPRRAGPWRRLCVSLTCGGISVGLGLLPLPGTEDLHRWLGREVGLPALFNLSAAHEQLSVMALGINPIVSAFVAIEVLALFLPSWRAWRIEGYEGRARLRHFVIALAALFAVVQAAGMATYLADLGAKGTPFLPYPMRPWAPRAAIGVLALGTLTCGLLAAAIDRWGLGQGFSVLILANSAGPLARGAAEVALEARANTDGISGALLLQLALWIAALIAITLALTRKGPFRQTEEPFPVPTPPSGLDPLIITAWLMTAPAALGRNLGFEFPDLRDLGTFGYELIRLVVVASLCVALAVLYNQPPRVARVWFDRPVGEADLGTVRTRLADATLRGAALLLTIAALERVFPELFGVQALWRVSVALFCTAIALDLFEEWGFRRAQGEIQGVWPVHRVYAVQPALEALRAAGIPAFPRGLHHRTLLQFLGPHVPVTLLVPVEKVEDAERIVRARLAPGMEIEGVVHRSARHRPTAPAGLE